MKFKTIALLIMLSAFSAGCVTEKAFPDPEVKPSEERSKIHAELAGNYLQRGQLEVAIEEIEKSLELDKNNKGANYIMALIQLKLKKPEKAERYFKKAVAEPDPLPNAEHDYANYLCKREKYEEAEKLYKGLLDNPLYQAKARLLLSIGGCFYKQEKYEEAKNALKQSLRLAPNSTATLFTLASISHIQGDALEARGWYQRYFQLSKNANPEILYIAYLTEKTLGDLDASATYALKLKNLYPLSPQAKKLKR